ncbi:hypothetical protein LLE49_25910 [Alicyclobacillus tolerans]|uniref:hypothetical protein n=1 Tax=Alicyclobacillus tolerans TaxID=90970 RepID=UPI001F28F633|nr:hypothetical protein [Alicyclobacillus tolerans]MCF8568165.1 hypothetical protein [Alicyclobacillus tolerans]
MKWRLIQFIGGGLIYLVLRSQLYGFWRALGDVLYATGLLLMLFAVFRTRQNN